MISLSIFSDFMKTIGYASQNSEEVSIYGQDSKVCNLQKIELKDLRLNKSQVSVETSSAAEPLKNSHAPALALELSSRLWLQFRHRIIGTFQSQQSQKVLFR